MRIIGLLQSLIRGTFEYVTRLCASTHPPYAALGVWNGLQQPGSNRRGQPRISQRHCISASCALLLPAPTHEHPHTQNRWPIE